MIYGDGAAGRFVPCQFKRTAVAGDAALLFDPRDPRALAGALRTLLAGGPAVERLIAAGHERATQFTWERTARLTLASYARTLAEA